MPVGSAPAAASAPPAGTGSADVAVDGGGPELGAACELALAEMRVDEALFLLQQRQQQDQHQHQHHPHSHQQRPAVGGKGSAGGAPSLSAGAAAPAAPVGSVTPAGAPDGATAGAVATAALGTSSVEGTGKQEAAIRSGGGGGGGGARGSPNGGDGRSRRSPEELAEEAAEHLSIADRAMLQLEPWFAAVERSLDGVGGGGGGDREAGACDVGRGSDILWGIVFFFSPFFLLLFFFARFFFV